MSSCRHFIGRATRLIVYSTPSSEKPEQPRKLTSGDAAAAIHPGASTLSAHAACVPGEVAEEDISFAYSE
jgi:hypothetical protein